MKSNEEMARSVLERVKKAKARQVRIRSTVVSVAACACVALLAVFGAAERWSMSMETTNTHLSVFSVSAAEYKSMIEDLEFPLGIIRVRDVSDNTELEKVFIRREILAEGEALGDGALVSTRTMRESNDVMVMVAFAERLMVIPEDIGAVADYSVTAQTGDNCWCNINPGKDKETGELYRGIEVNWYPPTTYFDMLLENPETSLSELADTITVTVRFTDGSVETAVVDVNGDDDGNIFMTYRGTK